MKLKDERRVTVLGVVATAEEVGIRRCRSEAGLGDTAQCLMDHIARPGEARKRETLDYPDRLDEAGEKDVRMQREQLGWAAFRGQNRSQGFIRKRGRTRRDRVDVKALLIRIKRRQRRQA